MTVFVNNKELVTNCTSLAELAAEQQLPAKGIAIAVNNKMVPRADWETYALADGQHITILKAFCGG